MVAHPLKDFMVRFRAGDTVYREGDPGSEMFIVHSGAVEIFREMEGRRQVLALMEKGDFFGEMSVLEGSPRTAAARAVEDSELIEINSTIFDRMIRGNIEVAVRMMRKLSARLQEASRQVEGMRSAGAVPVPVDLDRLPAAGAEIAAPPAAPPAPASAPGKPVSLPADSLGALVLGAGEHVFPIRGETSLIGRFDPVTGTRPEVDLTPFDTNRSVSRRHARVTARNGILHISEEVGALNGTFLNGRRLTPGKAEPIQPGDTVALGMVELKFMGKNDTAPAGSRGRSPAAKER